MHTIIEALEPLENNLKSLLSRCHHLVEENQRLLKNTSILQDQLLEKQELLKQREKEFEFLKIAKTIQGSGTNTKGTKFKLNALIREIDHCIIQLNE